MKHLQHSNTTGKPHRKSTGEKWIKLGDAAGTLAKKVLLQGYARGALSVDTTQTLIDKAGVNEK